MIKDQNYLNGAIITLELIEKMFLHLLENKRTNQFLRFLEKLEETDNILKKQLKLDSLLLEKNLNTKYEKNYWEGVDNIIKTSKQKWLVLHDHKKFLHFIQNNREKLKRNLALQKKLNTIRNLPPHNSVNKEFDRRQKNFPDVTGNNASTKDLHDLYSSVEQLNSTISNLPELLKQEINHLIEKKIVIEIIKMKKEILELLTEIIRNDDIKTQNEKILEERFLFKSDKKSLNDHEDKSVSDRNGSTEKALNLEQKERINKKKSNKSLIDDFSTLTLRDALRILRDEDSI